MNKRQAYYKKTKNQGKYVNYILEGKKTKKTKIMKNLL